MIDVGQGDCFLIQQPFQKGNILIDTGGLVNQDVASDIIVPYLRSIGVFHLDYVYISHDDYDHCGALESLQELMPIETIVNKYDKKRVIGDVVIEMLETNGTNKNDQSLVLYVTIEDMHYLFTGDISMEIEQQLLTTYQHLDVDVLKVAHHGSNSSTSNALFQLIEPKVALISVGVNNRYHHPNDQVITRLKHQGVTIYRSDLDGMVTIRYHQNRHYIYTMLDSSLYS